MGDDFFFSLLLPGFLLRTTYLFSSSLFGVLVMSSIPPSFVNSHVSTKCIVFVDEDGGGDGGGVGGGDDVEDDEVIEEEGADSV